MAIGARSIGGFFFSTSPSFRNRFRQDAPLTQNLRRFFVKILPVSCKCGENLLSLQR